MRSFLGLHSIDILATDEDGKLTTESHRKGMQNDSIKEINR
jgi:hypothetical protein